MFWLFLFSSPIEQGEKSIELYSIKEPLKVEIALFGKIRIIPHSKRSITLSYRCTREVKERLSFELVENKRVVIKVNKDTVRDIEELKKNEFEIKIPKDITLELEISTGVSENEIELGRIRAEKFLFNTGVSGGTLSFSSPARIEQIEINAGVGSLKIEKLGNANASHVKINAGIAKVKIDLGGKWEKKSKLFLSSAFASWYIKAPEELPLRISSEGILNIGAREKNEPSPRVEIKIEGAFNLFDFERY